MQFIENCCTADIEILTNYFGKTGPLRERVEVTFLTTFFCQLDMWGTEEVVSFIQEGRQRGVEVVVSHYAGQLAEKCHNHFPTK